MSIGNASAADWPALCKVWLASFPDGQEYWDWFHARVWRPEQTVVLRKDGTIVSCLLRLPCTFSPEGLRAQYLYAVATAPEARGKGLMAGLLSYAEMQARAEGLDLSVLLTETDSLQEYYARFGYRPSCIWAQRPVQALPLQGMFRPMTEADLPAVASLYTSTAVHLSAVKREEFDWRLQLELFRDGASVAEYGGETTAYCFYDERGVLEAAGPEAPALAYACAPDSSCWSTLPRAGEAGKTVGCALPLTPRGEAALLRGPLYLNMMFN